MRIFLVRHGQSEWQLSGDHNLDSDLTELGVQQSSLLSRWWGGEQFRGSPFRVNSIAVSPLIRARQTAAPLEMVLGCESVVVESLSESDFHVADHLPARNGPFDDQPDDISSAQYLAFRRQASQALDALVEKSKEGGPVLAVSHGGLIKTLLRVAIRSDAICFHVFNTGIIQLEWRRGRWHLVYVNHLAHLPEALQTV